eukprot:scaffold287034_cov32-Tisochrysis_lutea.AAC.4
MRTARSSHNHTRTVETVMVAAPAASEAATVTRGSSRRSSSSRHRSHSPACPAPRSLGRRSRGSSHSSKARVWQSSHRAQGSSAAAQAGYEPFRQCEVRAGAALS